MLSLPSGPNAIQGVPKLADFALVVAGPTIKVSAHAFDGDFGTTAPRHAADLVATTERVAQVL